MLHYIEVCPTKSHRKAKYNDGVNVNLACDDDGDRTWINKNRFDEFESDYQQAQDDSSLSTTSSVEFEIHIRMVKIETKLDDIKKWIPMTTVHGGDNSIKLFIQQKILRWCMPTKTAIRKFNQWA